MLIEQLGKLVQIDTTLGWGSLSPYTVQGLTRSLDGDVNICLC